ncbi:hypothetical protein Pcinc_010804 [Petrolisthes cinctipes]|uniref:Uncharacterized protein n=1 Tax=Petrolisthes cinctipes TaxID=88211 RepID=A0AAE1KT93_PETCI|nr:hypothetical protein Pcinc_010804 [Petrolisthes cinctipes]
MATTATTPFDAALGRDAGGPTVGGGGDQFMSASAKLITVLAFAAVFAIVLIAIFAMNLAWTSPPMSSDSGSEAGARSTGGEDIDEEDKTASFKKYNIRDYIGVVMSSIMLVTLLPGFYFANNV